LGGFTQFRTESTKEEIQMDTAMTLATEMAMSVGSHLRPRDLEIAGASSAGWCSAARAGMAIPQGHHRYNQNKFPPRMGPPSCSPPV
jgi:hypothetical protein